MILTTFVADPVFALPFSFTRYFFDSVLFHNPIYRFFLRKMRERWMKTGNEMISTGKVILETFQRCRSWIWNSNSQFIQNVFSPGFHLQPLHNRPHPKFFGVSISVLAPLQIYPRNFPVNGEWKISRITWNKTSSAVSFITITTTFRGSFRMKIFRFLRSA